MNILTCNSAINNVSEPLYVCTMRWFARLHFGLQTPTTRITMTHQMHKRSLYAAIKHLLCIFVVLLLADRVSGHFSTRNCSDIDTLMREDIRDGLRILADYENFHPLTHKHTAGVRALQELVAMGIDTVGKWCQVSMKSTEDTQLCQHCIESHSDAATMGRDSVQDAVINAVNFVSAVYHNIYRPYVEYDGEYRPNVVVVGGGPVGLASAIVAFSAGANVTAVEKRGNYTRNTWFDLGPATWYPSLLWLEKFGYKHVPLEYITTSIDTERVIVTIRCQILERFLSKVATILNLPLLYNTKLVELYPEESKVKLSTCAAKDSPDCTYFLNFDLLIGADGAKSVTRHLLGIEYKENTHIVLDEDIEFDVPTVYQNNLFVDIKAINGSCPPLAEEDKLYGNAIDHIAISMLVDGVTAVFKRFYEGHCHLQIALASKAKHLLTDLMKITTEMQQNARSGTLEERKQYFAEKIAQAVPWSFIKDVLNALLVQDVESEDDAKALVAENHYGLLAVDALTVSAKVAANAAIVCGKDKRMSMALLVGDSRVSPHFRLGIGVNYAFRTLHQIMDIVSQWNNATSSSISHFVSFVEGHNAKAMDAARKMAQIETSTIYLEAYCGLVVGFNLTASDIDNAQLIYEKMEDRYARKEPYLQLLTPVEVLSKCFGAQ